MESIAVLTQRINYTFANNDYLQTALTHRSAQGNNNERMEFLGDAILSYLISIELYRCFPQAKEGELSRLRASLVKGETLGEIASEIKLGDFLVMGSGELKSGGYRRSSTLADALEALIGAVYLDGGLDAASQLIQLLFSSRLTVCDPAKAQKDPKTRLQEYLQSHGQALPDYEVTATQGQAHNQTFQVACRIEGIQKVVYGDGSSRRKAEQMAAEAALELLGQ